MSDQLPPYYNPVQPGVDWPQSGTVYGQNTPYRQPIRYPGERPPQQPAGYPGERPPQQPYVAPGMYPPAMWYQPYPGGPPIVMPQPEQGGGMAIAGLVLGIISIVMWFYIWIELPVAIVGIILSALGRRSVIRRTMANWGLGLSIAGLVLMFCFYGLVILIAMQTPSHP